MKLIRMKLRFWVATLFLLSLSSLSFAAAEIYKLDPAHSYVQWHISHFGFSYPSGKWMASGTLSLDEAKPSDSKVNASIHIADLITGIPELDKHLKSPNFFDVDKYPDATFVSDKVVMTGKDSAKVTGTLTLHGVSKPITLSVKLNKAGINPINDKMTAGFTATATLLRSDFGITSYLPGLGDEVKLDIQAESNRDK